MSRTKLHAKMKGCRLLLTGLCLLGAGAAQARQAAPAAEHFDLDVREASLGDALRAVAQHTGIRLLYDPSLVAEQDVTCEARGETAGGLLDCVLRQTDLRWGRLPSGTYVLEPAPPDEGEQEALREHTISGFVSDAETGERLIGATLYEPARQAGTTTNAYGFFSLTLPAGAATLKVSYVGYEPREDSLLIEADRRWDVALKPASLELGGVEVEASRLERVEERTQMSAVSLPAERVQSVPALAGEADVLRVMQLLPGVQSGHEGTTGLYVRGGSPDQTLILLDGAPVYNASHLLGFLSVFNADAVRHAELTKGGFPARHGGRLSSVLEMSMKEGNLKAFGGAGAVGLLSGHVLAEGPIVRDRASFMVSGRRSLVDLLGGVVLDAPGYAFYDANAKVNYAPTGRDRVYLSLYVGDDDYDEVRRNTTEAGGTSGATFSERSRKRIGWGNTIGTLRWNRLFGERLFGNLLLLYSDYRFETLDEEARTARLAGDVRQAEQVLRYRSGVRDWGAKLDLDYVPGSRHYVRFGVQATRHTFGTGTTQFLRAASGATAGSRTLTPDADVEATELAAYVEDDVRLTGRLSANLGVHASAFAVEGRRYTSVQPRLAARYLLAEAWALKLSYARMTQYVHLLANGGLGLPTDLWVPSTARVRPEEAHQVAAGVATTLGDAFELSVEGYYKAMDGLIEYEEGASLLSPNGTWQDRVTAGEGRSYGAELFLQKAAGRTTGWVGYTLAWSERTFGGLNRGRTFPYKFDRRHDLALTLAHRLSGRLQLSATWTYATGNAVTLATARYRSSLTGVSNSPNVTCDNCGTAQIERRNGFRMPAYHRLDLGATWRLSGRGGDHTLTAGIYNAYNRQNPYYLSYGTKSLGVQEFEEGDAVSQYVPVVKQTSLFPFLPSLSYRFSF